VTRATAPRPSGPADVDAALARLYRLHPKRIDLSLGRMHRMLAALGDPHRRVPPVVHVAGTNGKGSVVAFARAMLEAAGYRVNAYTSPHLVRFNERIRLTGNPVEDGHLVELLDRCETANADAPITYFEVTTAAAFLAFAEAPADVLLLEVGLGGRLDATNVVDRPLSTAITRVSMDHRQFLGDTLGAIAFEKAGIAKPGVPLVLGPQAPGEAGATVRAVVAAAAARAGAPLAAADRDWRVADGGDGFVLSERGEDRRSWPMPALAGRHQRDNAATAIRMLAPLADHGLAVPDAAIRRGLAEVAWPARLQRLTRGPLRERLPPDVALWLDGGHNDSAGEVLADWAAASVGGGPLHLVVGMLDSKDPREFLAPLAPLAASVTAVGIPDEPAGLSAEALAEGVRAAGGSPVATAASAAAAIEALAATVRGPARVLICGSLYLAGSILVANG